LIAAGGRSPSNFTGKPLDVLIVYACFVARAGELIGSLIVIVAVGPSMTKIETRVMAVGSILGWLPGERCDRPTVASVRSDRQRLAHQRVATDKTVAAKPRQR
jgi:hypothetical protein